MIDLHRNSVTRTRLPPDSAAARLDGVHAVVFGAGECVRVLTDFLLRHRRLAVLTGAGLSTGSGIPDYRDDDGNWKPGAPVQYADFVAQASVRQRYWARSLYGWRRIAEASPNAAHDCIRRLEDAGRITGIITQNVDDLHRRSGSRNVVDLHGTLSRIRCLGCGERTRRADFQSMLEHCNPGWDAAVTRIGPDGDSTLAADDFAGFNVPACELCGGVLKPDVVFFGESVPAARVARARELVSGADGLLVIGSSLMVFSGFRFVRTAHAAGLPIAILNRGVTRADRLVAFRLACDCVTVLSGTMSAIGA